MPIVFNPMLCAKSDIVMGQFFTIRLVPMHRCWVFATSDDDLNADYADYVDYVDDAD